MNGSAPPPIPTATANLRKYVHSSAAWAWARGRRQAGDLQVGGDGQISHAVGRLSPIRRGANHRLNGRELPPTLPWGGGEERGGSRQRPPQDPNPRTHATKRGGGARGGAQQITQGGVGRPGQWPAAVCRAELLAKIRVAGGRSLSPTAMQRRTAHLWQAQLSTPRSSLSRSSSPPSALVSVAAWLDSGERERAVVVVVVV